MIQRRFEAVARQVNPLIKAHVFLRRANLSAEKQSQITGAAMSRYEYESLRDAMLTAIPRAGAGVFPYMENSQERVLFK